MQIHLKNFSLNSQIKSQYSLALAYDIIFTALDMSKDNEEFALTLNGKKSKLKRGDFEKEMAQSGVDEKVVHNIYSKFEKVLSEWKRFIDVSFLNEKTKAKYKNLFQ